MSLVEENWQTTRPTIRERAKFIFNNDRFSDVKFVVRKMDGEIESKYVIPAHKFVLSISSPVFVFLTFTLIFFEKKDCFVLFRFFFFLRQAPLGLQLDLLALQ